MANLEHIRTPDQIFHDWVIRFASEHNYTINQDFIDTIRLLQGKSSLQKAKFFFEHLVRLHLDESSLLAGLLFYPVLDKDINLNEIPLAPVRKLIESLQRFSPTDTVATKSSLFQHRSQQTQNEAVRKMLISLVDDPRVVVLKLCERTVALQATNKDSEEARKIAIELQNFYNPLASRLGIWQIKWAMEDMSFRTLQPDEYNRIAKKLASRRKDREVQIETICKDLQWRLSVNQITARIEGRAKSIFGIWSKMRDKRISFDQVYDAQALRVVVDNVSECYHVLGVVHTSWPHLTDEFDDYIASPKGNGYRSIHTTVIGPRGKNLEVQIRTEEMDKQAELGVCAHWRYKGMDKESLTAEKVDWLREVLHWHEGLIHQESSQPLHDTTEDRQIYLTTPKGHVVEIVAGATPIDFAYRIHTEIGHTCIGALVDGQESLLNASLQTGQQVEIITRHGATPQRIWLQPSRGYVKTSRARESIQNWFREHSNEQNRDAGRIWLKEEFEKLGLTFEPQTLAEENGYEKVDDFYVDIALGNVLMREIATRVLRDNDIPVGNQWISLIARDRPGLLRDVTNAVLDLELNVVTSTSRTKADDPKAWIELELDIKKPEDIPILLDNLTLVRGIQHVRRGRMSDLTARLEGHD